MLLRERVACTGPYLQENRKPQELGMRRGSCHNVAPELDIVPRELVSSEKLKENIVGGLKKGEKLKEEQLFRFMKSLLLD